MDAIALRPRKATEIVDASIEVYRRNPIHFILLTSIVHVPWLILQIVFVGAGTASEEIIASLMIGVGTLITYLLMSGLIVHMASELYLGRETDAFETMRQVGGKLPRVFIGAVIQTLAVVIGLVLFLFPAVYISALYFAVVPAIVLENRSVVGSFRRSMALSEGLKMHILSALGVIVLIRLVIQIGVMIIVTLIPLPPFRHVIVAMSAILIYPVIGISEALIYYDARIRKEGFDIEMMAAAGAEAPPVAV